VKRIITVALLLAIMGNQVFSMKNAAASVSYQISPELQKAQALLENMSPEERVGQLFLVTYLGSDVGEGSSIAKLVSDQHIGGVILRADNDNFAASEALPMLIKSTIDNLQTTNWKSTIAGIETGAGTVQSAGNYIPLFVGISQEGDLAPNDQIINGLTPLPSAMAIGATWKPTNAEAVGKILGSELEAMGFNLVLGPSLDVLDLVRTDIGEDLGVRTFGGDPYWVGQFGKAYIKGVHEGSNSKILVISKHFPGRGGSDRMPEDEVATVRKSLEQLKQIELSPFISVTQAGENLLEQTDGLLLSHIRYQGFQGNIRATTRPVSFDESALNEILALEQFSGWREQGGLIVSDDLGSAAVQKFFAPTGTNFDARQVAKSALLAGNDLLYLGNIHSTNDETSYATTVKTHEYFVQKYKEDPVFQQRVDEAVLRILTVKFRLYPYFSLGIVTVSDTNLDQVGISQQVTLDIARQAVTLVSPLAQDLNVDLPNPPLSDDQIIFISDVIPQSQCTTCYGQSIFLADELMAAIIRLYGPATGDLVQVNNLSSYTFENLRDYLNGIESNNSFGSKIENAEWIVFAFSEFRMNSEESLAFQKLFSSKPGTISNKKIIGFAFNAPYYPDATDISKFTAYYALYSKTPQFIEIAARTMFKEITPTGILPVSVSSIGYDLITATTPDPNQVIPLMVVKDSTTLGETESSSTSTDDVIVINAGDNLPLQTGIIKDHNGNPVPDGTIVRFIIDTQTSSGTVEQIEAQTTNGFARTGYRIPDKGTVLLKVTADPATVSQILQIEITGSGGTLTSIDPTFEPTGSIAEVEPTPTSSGVVLETVNRHVQGLPGFVDWFLSTILIGISVAALYRYGTKRRKTSWNPWIPLITGFGGYTFYLFPIMGLDFVQKEVKDFGTAAIVVLALAGCIVGGVIVIIIRLLVKSKTN